MKLTIKPLWVMTAMVAMATGTSAQTFTVLKTFNPNINPTGFHSMGTLAQGPDGTLYGVTTDGGAGAAGVVFRVQTNGTAFTVIKSFSLINVATGTNADGATPEAGLVLSGSTLFGTTSAGGSGGSGTVFSLSTNGSNFTVLKSFSTLDTVVWTNSDGANPAAALIVSNGVLYGTTPNGGTNGQGTVFALQTNGNGFANIYHFRNSSDGSVPAGRLLLSGGTLYGTAQYSDGAGTVFSLSTNGTGFVTLHDFSGSGTDGANPCAGLVLSGGQLFGTTQYGDSGDGSDDGTVFRVDINGNNFTNLYSFTDSVGVGFTPDAELLLSGSTLYGVTGNGGFGFGTVFKINTDGSGFETVVNLNIIAGWGPDGGLVLSGGVLYGGTGLGGMPGLGNGVVYSVPTDGSSLTALVIFAGTSGAADPDTGLALSGNTLYGTTEGGGTNGTGTLFEIGTNGSGYAEIKDFSITDSSGDNPDGADPRAVLVLSGGTFYGTTRYGGTAGWGTVFKLNADGTGFTNIYSFTDPYPICAWAPLVVSGSTLYGTGSGGSFGSVFRINTDGSGFTNFYMFNGTDGNNPSAGWTLSGNVLYGTTMNGGSGYGNIFQLNTDGSHYTNIYSFSGGNDGAGRARFWSCRMAFYMERRITAAPTARARCSRSIPTAAPSPCSTTLRAPTMARARATWCCQAGRFTGQPLGAAVPTAAAFSSSTPRATITGYCTTLPAAATGRIPTGRWYYWATRSTEPQKTAAFQVMARCSRWDCRPALHRFHLTSRPSTGLWC